MTQNILPVSFFFGVNNKSGYCSLFGDLFDLYQRGRHYILKGGPGTGKSTLMKKVAVKLDSEGCFTERGFCSADPSSLDIVLATEKNFSILDGTSPHTVEPVLPGVSQHIVDLGAAWDRKYLDEHAEEIGALVAENKAMHKKATAFTDVAAQFETKNALICAGFTDEEKLQRYVNRLAHRIIHEKKKGGKGKIKKRFLSAVTPDGIVVQYDTIVALAEKVFSIEDEFCTVAPYMVEYIANYAVMNGYDVYACYCPLFPMFKMEHVIIPELKVAVFTENGYHRSIDEYGNRIHVSRFYNMAEFNANKEKLRFNKKAKKELIDEAVRKMSLAKDIHDRLEEYYIKATNFDVINEMGEKIIKSI